MEYGIRARPIDDLVAEGDKVVVRFRVEGRHGGDLLGVPPSGRRLRASGISILRLVDGRVAENWEEDDRLGLLQQLGAIPSMGPGSPEVAESPAVEAGNVNLTSSRSSDENKVIVRRLHDEIFNERRLERADDLFTEDYVDHGALPGQPYRGSIQQGFLGREVAVDRGDGNAGARRHGRVGSGRSAISRRRCPRSTAP